MYNIYVQCRESDDLYLGKHGHQMAVAKSHWAKGIEQEFAGKARQGNRINQFNYIKNFEYDSVKMIRQTIDR